jgi:hypothetical protein
MSNLQKLGVQRAKKLEKVGAKVGRC